MDGPGRRRRSRDSPRTRRRRSRCADGDCRSTRRSPSLTRPCATASPSPGSTRWPRLREVPARRASGGWLRTRTGGRTIRSSRCCARSRSTYPGWRSNPRCASAGELGLSVRADLVDRRLRIVIEADSFEWHGDRTALRRDARRYDLLVANGWTVLRFSWEDVMHDPDFVRAVLQATVVRTRTGIGARRPPRDSRPAGAFGPSDGRGRRRPSHRGSEQVSRGRDRGRAGACRASRPSAW